jgi:predicted O-linked N-acetylglucosamine transferase (SPINDLY family)
MWPSAQVCVSLSRSLVTAAAEASVAATVASTLALASCSRTGSRPPLRVAFVGNDFSSHPMGWLTLGFLTHFDRTRILPLCYHYGRGLQFAPLATLVEHSAPSPTEPGHSSTDAMTQRLALACGAFFHTVMQSHDSAVADHIANSRADILLRAAGRRVGCTVSV